VPHVRPGYAPILHLEPISASSRIGVEVGLVERDQVIDKGACEWVSNGLMATVVLQTMTQVHNQSHVRKLI
jgi:hypothetical protein